MRVLAARRPTREPAAVVVRATSRLTGVKANQGAAGVDGQSIAEFEADLEDNLYKLWNRLSSGSYFPRALSHVVTFLRF